MPEDDEKVSHEPADVETVIAEFETRKDILEAFCDKTRGLIEACLQDAKIPYQSVQSRVKSKDKLRRKYLDTAKNYKTLDDITDLAGLRVITYYEDDVDHVSELIKRHFTIDLENSVDKRETEPDRFGYYALNYVCTHTDQRSADVEYKRFAGICCEVQITSVLRHAWSEIQHDWYDMKADFPDDIKRRFARMAALLEIAESEFLDLRKKKDSYLRAVDVQVEARVPDMPLDRASLAAFIGQDPTVTELDLMVVQYSGIPLSAELQPVLLTLLLEASRFAGLSTLNLLREAVAKYGKFLVEYVKEARVYASARRRGNALVRGVSVLQIVMMIAGMRGQNELLELMKSANFAAEGELTDIARERAVASACILSKFADEDSAAGCPTDT
jgi:GTP pyrophosphokinase